MWGYSDIIQRLSSVFCVSQFIKRVQDPQEYCLCAGDQGSGISNGLTKKQSEWCKIEGEINLHLNYRLIQFDSKVSRENFKANLYEIESRIEDRNEMKSTKPTLEKRKRKTDEVDIRQSLLKLRTRLLNNSISGFSASSKKARSVTKKNLRRRSKYIGVSKNNSNWQALVNVDQVKRYIGTFTNELEAARTYDLYSVAIREEEASLNFSYTSQQMLEQVDHYLQHNRIKIYD
ncbi:unnamed protein product [Moneuplotes crassus]|uniref:AP2/ERF domain-containing protein n=1 Tax=Euplotes crassus TaxID=5936 RepID=A0AAD2CY21_EUPCR|nr:unnamed protein product [Moneuplotes crassus]